MTIAEWLTQATDKLQLHTIESARLDCILLLEDVLSKDRSWILAHDEYGLEPKTLTRLNDWINARTKHVPIAQLRGHAEFYGRDFIVTADVLQPRPESEAIIEALKKIVLTASDDTFTSNGAQDYTYGIRINGSAGEADGTTENSGLLSTPAGKALRIADIGTGSGALGITAKLELPSVSVDLIEVDDAALEIAKRNVTKHTTDVRLVKSDLLAATPKDYDILLCNLPYIPDDYAINEAARHEPPIALFGGPDGLDVYRKLLYQIANIENEPLYLITESLLEQHGLLKELMDYSGYVLLECDGLVQIFGRQ